MGVHLGSRDLLKFWELLVYHCIGGGLSSVAGFKERMQPFSVRTRQCYASKVAGMSRGPASMILSGAAGR